MSAQGPPRTVRGTDGREHVEYDLLLTNALDAPVTVRSVEVPDRWKASHAASRGRARRRHARPATLTADHHRSLPGTVATVIDLVVARQSRWAGITHRIVYEVPPDAASVT